MHKHYQQPFWHSRLFITSKNSIVSTGDTNSFRVYSRRVRIKTSSSFYQGWQKAMVSLLSSSKFSGNYGILSIIFSVLHAVRHWKNRKYNNDDTERCSLRNECHITKTFWLHNALYSWLHPILYRQSQRHTWSKVSGYGRTRRGRVVRPRRCKWQAHILEQEFLPIKRKCRKRVPCA